MTDGKCVGRLFELIGCLVAIVSACFFHTATFSLANNKIGCQRLSKWSHSWKYKFTKTVL